MFINLLRCHFTLEPPQSRFRNIEGPLSVIFQTHHSALGTYTSLFFLPAGPSLRLSNGPFLRHFDSPGLQLLTKPVMATFNEVCLRFLSKDMIGPNFSRPNKEIRKDPKRISKRRPKREKCNGPTYRQNSTNYCRGLGDLQTSFCAKQKLFDHYFSRMSSIFNFWSASPLSQPGTDSDGE